MTEIDNAQTIVDTAIATTDPATLEPGKIYGWLTPAGQVHQIDLSGDDYRDQPKLKDGTTVVEDLDSFLNYWGKHSDADSELYVNIKAHTITAVLDANQRDGARWGQHRLLLKMATSDRWNDWASNDRQPVKQLAWAEFIEDHLEDIRDPDAATMLEIAQTFQANTKVKFGSTAILSNGDRRLQWEETTDASAGTSGKLQVPTEFKIGVAPFDFADAWELTARFRYRVESGQLYVTYLLNDPAAVIRGAVLDIVAKLEQALSPAGDNATPSHKVMRGAPA